MTYEPGIEIFTTYRTIYWDALLKDVIPFWDRYSLDRECGGYFTCLDRDGSVYDTDKFMWLQARQVWLYSMLYNRLKKKDSWLETARLGQEFLKRFGRDDKGDWYFSLTREGQPLVQPYNIFSDCFAAMAFSQYALAAGDEESKAIADQTLHRILERFHNPKGIYSKAYPDTRSMKSLALPMILCNVCLEMEWMISKEILETTIEKCINAVMNDFLDPDRLLLYENIGIDGSRLDCFEGRCSIPGHGIEAMWFLMAIARRKKDQALMNRCTDIMLSLLQYGWDEKYDGIVYFRDLKGMPPLQLEWDQKLWWVHLETLIALIMGYAETKRIECWEWFKKVQTYTWANFPDRECGEWYGYLNRRGEILLNLKGGKWKGCFHVPRALFLCAKELDQLSGVGEKTV